jgi:hypothetical protein
MRGTHSRGRQSLLVRLAHIAAGVVLALTALGFLVAAIEETRWAFTTVVPARLCGDGQGGPCVTRTPALVVAANGSRFTASYDEARRARGVHVVDGPAPAVGSHVVLEEWKDRLVSVLGPSGQRRHAEEWPDLRHDLGEGLGAILGLLLSGGALIWMIALLTAPRPRRAPAAAVSEELART